MKTVLYLIQARGKLPDIYQCLRKRSWLLLSYRDNTGDTTIHAPNTTWTQGRNLLYKHVREHKLLYDYYVFLDEDLVFRKVSLDIAISRHLPFRLRYHYKHFLESREENMAHQEAGFANFEAAIDLNYPLVRPLDYNWFMGRAKHDNLRAALQTTGEYDQNFIAIAREAFFAETILPYREEYDSISWDLSGAYQNVKANHHYPKQVVQDNQYTVFNTQHSNYTRKVAAVNEFYDRVIGELGISPELSPARLRGYCEEIESPFAQPWPDNFWHKVFSYIKVFAIASGYRIYRRYEKSKAKLKSMK